MTVAGYTHEEFIIRPPTPIVPERQRYSGTGSVEIHLKERSIWIGGITEEEQRDELKRALGPFVEAAIRRSDLKRSLRKEFSDRVIPLRVVKIRLGEEIFKKEVQSLPVKWIIPQDQLAPFSDLVENYIPDWEESAPSAHPELAKARAIWENFQKNSDYYMEDEALPSLIPLTKPICDRWPRVEIVKEALRDFFRREQILAKLETDPSGDIEGLKSLLEDAALRSSLDDLDSVEQTEIDWRNIREIKQENRDTLHRACLEVGLEVCFKKRGDILHFGQIRKKREKEEDRKEEWVLV